MTLTNKMKEMRRREEGFTIVELLIVIVVIAILAALVITSYLGIQSRARDAERQSDIRAIVTAVQAQATIDDGRYPTCADVPDIDNIESDALSPPGSTATTFKTGAATATDTQYVCISNPASPTGDTVDGLLFGYWSEAKEGGAGPVYRGVGDAPAEPS